MAASEARTRANRQNALKSTGPRTPEGKERSRRNAFKHGLTGQGVALPEEDQAEITRRFTDLQVEAEAAERPGPDATLEEDETCDPLASNLGEAERGAAEADPEPRTVPMVPPMPRMEGLRSIGRLVDGPMTAGGPFLASFEGAISV